MKSYISVYARTGEYMVIVVTEVLSMPRLILILAYCGEITYQSI